MKEKRVVIDLGCNGRTLKGYDSVIRVDLNKTSPDIVEADFNRLPLPFEDNYADEVHCYHVLEHIKEPAEFIEEIYRIAKPSADIFIGVPHYSSTVAYGDPSHLHRFSLLYFYYFGQKFKYRDIFTVVRTRFIIMPTTEIRYEDQPKYSMLKKVAASVLHFVPNLLPPLIADRFGWLFGGYHEINVCLRPRK